MKPRPRKRTRRDGGARRGRTLTARFVTRDCAASQFTPSRTSSVKGRSPRDWYGASTRTAKSPTASVDVLKTGVPSINTSTVVFGRNSVP